jgi:hypothetical protein
LETEPPTAKIKQMVINLKRELGELNKRAGKKTKVISEVDINEITSKAQTMESEWRKRKNIFKDLVGEISEKLEISEKELKDMVVVEEDNEMGVDVNCSTVVKFLNSKRLKSNRSAVI